METTGLPVLTDSVAFRFLEIGEQFYFPGLPARYEKVSDKTYMWCNIPGNPSPVLGECFAHPTLNVWRRIEP